MAGSLKPNLAGELCKVSSCPTNTRNSQGSTSDGNLQRRLCTTTSSSDLGKIVPPRKNGGTAEPLADNAATVSFPLVDRQHAVSCLETQDTCLKQASTSAISSSTLKAVATLGGIGVLSAQLSDCQTSGLHAGLKPLAQGLAARSGCENNSNSAVENRMDCLAAVDDNVVDEGMEMDKKENQKVISKPVFISANLNNNSEFDSEVENFGRSHLSQGHDQLDKVNFHFI